MQLQITCNTAQQKQQILKEVTFVADIVLTAQTAEKRTECGNHAYIETMKVNMKTHEPTVRQNW